MWTVEENGTATHVRMEIISSIVKVEMIVNETQKYVMRNCLTSDAGWNGQK